MKIAWILFGILETEFLILLFRQIVINDRLEEWVNWTKYVYMKNGFARNLDDPEEGGELISERKEGR